VPLLQLHDRPFRPVRLKPALNGLRKVSFRSQGFVVPLLYKYVRHPMMNVAANRACG
jgi:hypothetical protein